MEPNIDGQDEKEVGQESTSVMSGKEVESIRKSLRSTQKEVAEQIGVTASMVSKIERGLAKPSPEVASKLEKWAENAHKHSSMDYPELKNCSKCKCSLPVSEFGIDRSRKYGLQSKCRKCNVVSVDNWRKSQWENFLNRRKIARKLNSSHLRLAGHKWVSGDERTVNEIFQLVGPDVLYVHSSVWKSFPRDDGATILSIGDSAEDVRMRNYCYDEADRYFAEFGMGELYEENITPDFYEEFGAKLKALHENGVLSELQVERIVKLATR